ncbi:DUF3231 family protein [Piscibacillus sp. B03]|uniref:DUF3231 family protein n=1 Tax=Piscibacillus sp. B03 TaxID=3457430 RepID=UPI003FCCF757
MSSQSFSKLTASEITNLWNTYMNDAGAICQLNYQLNHVEDEDIKQVLETALEMSKSHVTKIEQLFNQDGYPIPHGFKLEEDVDITAPRLFTDVYFLMATSQMGKISVTNYSGAIRAAVREDVFKFFHNCLEDSIKLIELTNAILLKKGLSNRTPYLTKPHNFDFVESKGFLAGFFSERRPLTGAEIMNFYANHERNALGAATMMGYSQVTKNREVTEFFLRGNEIANKHCEIFGSYLKKFNIPEPMTWHSEVTDSTTYVYSDRKMMFYTSALIGISIAYYGAALSTSPRRDIGLTYVRLISELLNYADDGARLMIKNGWMEEPPRSVDRRELSKKNKN